MTVTNSDRADWADTAVEAFSDAAYFYADEPKTEKVRDLVCDLVHYLRLKCGLSLDEAVAVINHGVQMGQDETDSDPDNEKED